MIFDQHTDITTLISLKNKKGRLLGLDVGDKTVGVSLSDLSWLIASPYKLIHRQNNIRDFEQIQKIIHEESILALIIGLPLTLKGERGPQAEKVLQFTQKLESFVDTPLYLWDERLSTVAVTRTLLEADVSRRKRSTVVDKMAATFILQGVLDRLQYNKPKI